MHTGAREHAYVFTSRTQSFASFPLLLCPFSPSQLHSSDGFTYKAFTNNAWVLHIDGQEQAAAIASRLANPHLHCCHRLIRELKLGQVYHAGQCMLATLLVRKQQLMIDLCVEHSDCWAKLANSQSLMRVSEQGMHCVAGVVPALCACSPVQLECCRAWTAGNGWLCALLLV